MIPDLHSQRRHESRGRTLLYKFHRINNTIWGRNRALLCVLAVFVVRILIEPRRHKDREKRWFLPGKGEDFFWANLRPFGQEMRFANAGLL